MDEDAEVSRHRGPDDVHIAGNGIGMPIGRILLVRRGSETGAIRFLREWYRMLKRFRYAEYESYCCANPAGVFSPDNVIRKKETASSVFIMAHAVFGNNDVQCGQIHLFWSGDRMVYFYSENQYEGDYGVEFAPTIWTDISQVNLSDSRIKWYRYDGKRKRVNIPIDTHWSDNAREK